MLHELNDFVGSVRFLPQTLPMKFPVKFSELGISSYLIRFKFDREDLITIQKADKNIKPHSQIFTTRHSIFPTGQDV